MKALVLVVAATAVAVLAAGVEPARACSCVPPDPWALVKQADGAFVGRLVSRAERGNGAVLVFDVERAVKGDLGRRIEVETPSSSAGCGIVAPRGTRVGLFLDRVDGVWHGTLCAQVSPEDMLAATVLPAPSGAGAPALLVGGAFGPARMMTLDARGRTLGYGLGTGATVALSTCPGGRTIVEAVSVGSRYELAVRDASTLWLIRRQKLAFPERRRPQELRCEDAAGSSVIVFARRWCCDAPDGSAVYRVRPGRLTAVWNGRAYNGGLSGSVAYLCTPGGSHNAIRRLDLRTGSVRTVARLPSTACGLFEPNRSGSRLAGVTLGLEGPTSIVVIDLTRHPAKAVALRPQADGGGVHWLRDDRLLYVPSEGGDARVLDTRLRTLSRFRWLAAGSARVGTVVFGVRSNGTVVGAKLPSGPARVVRRLPGKPLFIVTA